MVSISERRLVSEVTLEAECFLVMRRSKAGRWAGLFDMLWLGRPWVLSRVGCEVGGGGEVVEMELQLREITDVASLLESAR